MPDPLLRLAAGARGEEALIVRERRRRVVFFRDKQASRASISVAARAQL